MDEAKSSDITKVMYRRMCSGYAGESHERIGQHLYYSYEKSLCENSHGICSVCSTLYRADIILAKAQKKTLEDKLQ